MRYLSGRGITLTHTFTDEDGATVAPSSVAVSALRDGADTPAGSGPATPAGSAFTFSTTALTEGVYTFTWTAVSPAIVDTEEIEVEGTQLFTVADIRKDPDLPANKYPPLMVREARDFITGEFEQITGRSFTRRTALLTFNHDGSGCEILPVRDTRSLNSITTPSGTADTADYALDADGFLSGLTECGTYTVEVSYGFVWVPKGIKDAAIEWCRFLMLEHNSAIPDRATSFQPANGGGIFQLLTPGRAGVEVGLPNVDAVLQRYGFRILRDITGV